MAQSRHHTVEFRCPLLGVKQTSVGGGLHSPSRLEGRLPGRGAGRWCVYRQVRRGMIEAGVAIAGGGRIQTATAHTPEATRTQNATLRQPSYSALLHADFGLGRYLFENRRVRTDPEIRAHAEVSQI